MYEIQKKKKKMKNPKIDRTTKYPKLRIRDEGSKVTNPRKNQTYVWNKDSKEKPSVQGEESRVMDRGRLIYDTNRFSGISPLYSQLQKYEFSWKSAVY